jgi:ribosomal protein S12 methylthiotransferase
MTAKDRAKKKVGLISLGCSKNLVNTEQMMHLLAEAGYQVSGETDGADVVLINTCGFIESAKMEAIETILDIAEAKEAGRVGRIIVAGCLAQRYKDEILSEIPEIDAAIGVGSFDEIVRAVAATEESREKHAFFGDINAPVSETGRIITTSPTWAYLKVAEGCSNRCAYCTIPEIRGRYRSRPMDSIIREARALTDRGIRELIIVAQDTTGYGYDLYGKRSLTALLTRLCDIEALKWIRLHYLYPGKVDDELIELIAGQEKVLNYLDIPIQHINDGILRKMGRSDTGKTTRELIKRSREHISGAVVRTSVIAGLPGEGEQEFEEFCDFLRDAKIQRAGVFQYSPEEGTAAALMDRPDEETAMRRAELLMDIQASVMEEYNRSRVGSMETVLIEGREDGSYIARSYAESPEVDGYIHVRGSGIKVHEFVDVRITGVEDGELVAVRVK